MLHKIILLYNTVIVFIRISNVSSSSLTCSPYTIHTVHRQVYNGNNKHHIISHRYHLSTILQRIRAGGIMDMYESDDDDDENEEDDDDEEQDEETVLDDDPREEEGDDDDERVESENDTEDDDEDEIKAASQTDEIQTNVSTDENTSIQSTPSSNNTSTSTASTYLPPVKVTLRTTMESPLIDQSIEFTASQTRTVASLKQAVSRQFRGRPPLGIISLTYRGRVLQDNTVLSDLIQDDYDDEDIYKEEEEKDDEDEDKDEESLKKINLVVNIIPPIDPKFGTELKERLPTLTPQELLDAYVANLAMMHQNSMDIMNQMDDKIEEGYMKTTTTTDIPQQYQQDNLDMSSSFSNSRESTLLHSITMRSHALTMRDMILQSLSDDVRKILLRTAKGNSQQGDVDEEQETSMGMESRDDSSLRQSIHGKLRKKRGGASMNVKRALQTQLNIDWPSTIRNALLFLFFGYFGGRNAFSRTVMLLGAPACFILQARPVKVFMKQIFYAIGEPPSILLSLLPAPQQAIMSYHYNEAIVQLYGNDSGNELIGSNDVYDDYDHDSEISDSHEIEEEEERDEQQDEEDDDVQDDDEEDTDEDEDE